MPIGYFKRELIVVFLTAAITIVSGCIGWFVLDRLELERKETIIDVSSGRLDKIEEQIRSLPPKVASENEIIVLQKQQAQDHWDVMTEFGQLENRMDQLVMASRHRASNESQTERPGSPPAGSTIIPR